MERRKYPSDLFSRGKLLLSGILTFTFLWQPGLDMSGFGIQFCFALVCASYLWWARRGPSCVSDSPLVDRWVAARIQAKIM